MLLHKILLVTSQKLHLSTYGKTCTRQNSNSKSDYGSHQNSTFLFRYKSGRNGEQLKGKPRQSAKAIKSIEIVKEKTEEMILNWQQTRR